MDKITESIEDCKMVSDPNSEEEEKLEDWKTPRIKAQMWCCGDECECCEGRIDLIMPNIKAGYPWIFRHVV